MAGGGDIRAGRAFVELFVKSTQFERGLKAASKTLDNIGSTFQSVGVKIAGFGAAGLAALGAAAQQFATVGDDLNKMAQRTGIAVETLSALKYAAQQSGASIDDVEKASKKMASVLHDAAGGSKAAEKTLSDLGLSIDDLKGLTPDQQFIKIATALSAVSDASERAALAQEIFGRSGTTLLPMFSEGAAGLAALTAEAQRLGVVMSTQDAQAATALGDAFDRVSTAAGAVVTNIGAALAPLLTDLADKVTALITPITQWIRSHQEQIVTLAKVSAGVTAGGLALVGFGKIMVGVSAVASKLAFSIGLVSKSILFLGTPVGIATGAVAGLTFGVGALAGVIVKASGIVPQLVDALKPLAAAVQTIATSLLSGDFKRAWEVAAASIQLAGSLGADVFKQLPEFAGYAAGRISRGLVDAFASSFKWILSTMNDVLGAMLNAAKDFSPKLLKAMLTGDISGAMEAFQKALLPVAKRVASSARSFGRGLTGGEAPTLNMSERTQGLIAALAGLTAPGQAGTPPEVTSSGAAKPGKGGGGFKLPFAIPSQEDLLKKISDLTNKAIGGGASLLDLLPDGSTGSTPMRSASRVSVGFSAAALMAQGMGGSGASDPVVKKVGEQVNEAKRHTSLLERIEKLLEKGNVFG